MNNMISENINLNAVVTVPVISQTGESTVDKNVVCFYFSMSLLNGVSNISMEVYDKQLCEEHKAIVQIKYSEFLERVRTRQTQLGMPITF